MGWAPDADGGRSAATRRGRRGDTGFARFLAMPGPRVSLWYPRRAIAAGSVLAILLAVASSARIAAEESPKGERFFLVIYGAQEEGDHPETSHCFATFARFAERRGASPLVELHHINWFSRRGHETGVPHGLASAGDRPIEPLPGENRHTREALLLARRRKLQVTRLGPYEIDRKLYERALRHIDLLEGRVPGRRVLYKQLDGGFREMRVVALNCIHAVSDIDRDAGPLRTGLAYGEEAAREVALHFERWIRHGMRDHPREWERIWSETWYPNPAPVPEMVRRGALSFEWKS